MSVTISSELTNTDYFLSTIYDLIIVIGSSLMNGSLKTENLQADKIREDLKKLYCNFPSKMQP